MQVKHYAEGRRYEPVDVIRDWQLSFNLGTALKYISRAGRKGDVKDMISDLSKAIDYLEDEKMYQLIKHLEVLNEKEIEDAD